MEFLRECLRCKIKMLEQGLYTGICNRCAQGEVLAYREEFLRLLDIVGEEDYVIIKRLLDRDVPLW